MLACRSAHPLVPAASWEALGGADLAAGKLGWSTFRGLVWHLPCGQGSGTESEACFDVERRLRTYESEELKPTCAEPILPKMRGAFASREIGFI